MKTGNRKIYRESEVRAETLAAVDMAALPVIETIGPMGKNVIYPNENGTRVITNDGVTILKSISVKDPLQDAVIEILKEGALRTNQVAGDATSTTTLFAYKLIHRVYELKRKGLSQRAIRDSLNRISDKLLGRLDKQKSHALSKEIEFNVAKISANNDADVAKLTVETMDATGVDGMVFIELGGGEETTLEKQLGYRIPNGMIYQNLYNNPAAPVATYKNIKVVIFDKSLYYAEECEQILRVAKEAGYNELVIVAKDFLGDAPNTFIANHAQGIIKLVLAKCNDDTSLEDLAVYLGGTVISEASGRRVESLSMADFVTAESVFADPTKVLIKNTQDNKILTKRVEGIKDELKKDKDNKTLKERLASLTSGLVTVKVGGRTATEARERAFRFEDAYSAVRVAKQYGYLVGGGLALYNAYNAKDYPNREDRETALILSRASITQLAENSMLDLDFDKITKDVGLNALTGEYENLLEAGVVEPYKAVEMAIKNAVSVADMITSIGTFIIEDVEEEKE